MNLKDYLSSKPDVREKDLAIGDDLTVRIRRLTVGERKRLYAAYRINTPEADLVGLTAELVAVSLVPALTVQEVEELPANIADRLMAAINEFNGWTTKGAAELADQFRPTA